MAKSLTVVVPVYNEEQRLPTAFRELDAFVRARPNLACEILFVDDGSRDRTADLVRAFQTACPVRLVSYLPNQGKGRAVKEGMLAATNEVALMVDADMSTPMDEYDAFQPFVDAGEPVVIGTRKNETAHVLKRQPLVRQKMGEVFTLLARLVTGVRVSDFTCGFKCFSREARAAIFEKARIDRWSYDAELLYLCRKEGLPIREVGVRWINDEQTRVRLGNDVWTSFRDLLKIPLIHR